MEIITYRKAITEKSIGQRMAEIALQGQDHTGEHEEHLQLCVKVGLNHQVQRLAIVEKQKQADIWYDRVSASDYAIWKNFLPTSYSWRGYLPDNLGIRNIWGKYDFDIVPIEVLREIEFAQNLNLFEDFLIRTPERQQSDPAVFGIISGEFYLIARWGESLIPFKKISTLLLKQQGVSNFMGFKLLVPSVFIGISLLAIIIKLIYG